MNMLLVADGVMVGGAVAVALGAVEIAKAAVGKIRNGKNGNGSTALKQVIDYQSKNQSAMQQILLLMERQHGACTACKTAIDNHEKSSGQAIDRFADKIIDGFKLAVMELKKKS